MNAIHRYFALFCMIIMLFAAACSKTESEQTIKEPAQKKHDHNHDHNDESGNKNFCVEHQIQEDECFFCNPALREHGRLWCSEHDRYEDRCFICHPELKESGRLWCEEHKLYEDECVFCHPELRNTQDNGKNTALKDETKKTSPGSLWCQEHGVSEAECGICHPELLDDLEIAQGLKIRLKSSESADKAGVKTERPVSGTQLGGFSVLGRVVYNQNDLVRITPLASGVIQEVLADVGSLVKKGQTLAVITSPELGKIKNDYLMALETEALKEIVFKREKNLVDKLISSRQEYEQARTDYQLAKNTTAMTRQHLLNYGLTEREVQKVQAERDGSFELPVAAPFSGTLIQRSAVVGEAVNPGDMLFTLADLSTMWLELSVPEDRLTSVIMGGQVEAVFDAFPEKTIPGTIIWISSEIDEQDRMIKARARIPNPDTLLKNRMFGQVKIIPEHRPEGVHLPAAALHEFNKNSFVFVKRAPDLYEIRRVSLGGRLNGRVEIIGGISPEEEVAVAHSFTLKSEFLKSKFGAGCVHD